MIALFIKYFVICLLIYYGIRFLSRIFFFLYLFRKANTPEARAHREQMFKDFYGNGNFSQNNTNPNTQQRDKQPIVTAKTNDNEDYIDFEEVK